MCGIRTTTTPGSRASRQDRAAARRIRAYAQPCPSRALRAFALEAAALLTDDLRAGAELDFDVIDQGGRRGPPCIATGRAPRSSSPSAGRACASSTLPASGGRARQRRGALAARERRRRRPSGEQAEPALRAMLERLYEDATSFGFPEERFERVYGEVEATLYRDALARGWSRRCAAWRSRPSASTSAAACRSCAARAPTRPPRRSGPRTATASPPCSACSSAT